MHKFLHILNVVFYCDRELGHTLIMMLTTVYCRCGCQAPIDGCLYMISLTAFTVKACPSVCWSSWMDCSSAIVIMTVMALYWGSTREWAGCPSMSPYISSICLYWIATWLWCQMWSYAYIYSRRVIGDELAIVMHSQSEHRAFLWLPVAVYCWWILINTSHTLAHTSDMASNIMFIFSPFVPLHSLIMFASLLKLQQRPFMKHICVYCLWMFIRHNFSDTVEVAFSKISMCWPRAISFSCTFITSFIHRNR